jgi:hypothetical protein
MRALTPNRLMLIEGRLWLVDHWQPVAAVIDPDGAGLVGSVSWTELPPGPDAVWPRPRVLTDGKRLWAQQEATGPVVLVGRNGLERSFWTGGLWLTACGAGVAWCAPAPPEQELVGDRHQPPLLSGPTPDSLLRLDITGGAVPVRTESRVRRVWAATDGVRVDVERDDYALRELGPGLFEVNRSTSCLALAWDQPPPPVLTVEELGLPEQEQAAETEPLWQALRRRSQEALVRQDGVSWYGGPDRCRPLPRTARWGPGRGRPGPPLQRRSGCRAPSAGR